jgi:hypothetical protein
VYRVLQQTELVAKRLLESRSTPLPSETNDKIANMLATGIGSHRHAISRSEALNHLGIEFVVKSEDAKIDDELWGMYEEYNDLFQFNIPFDFESDMIVNNLDKSEWKNLPVCCVESETRFDIKYVDVKARRLREIPPQISINLSNISLPPINIPNLPAGIDVGAFQQLVQALLQQYVQASINAEVGAVVDKLIASMPSPAIERTNYNVRWVKED